MEFCPHSPAAPSEAEHPLDSPPVDAREGLRSGWIGWSVVSGLVAGVPAGWLLAYLAALPFLLGLFFFVLLGLVVGAIMYRFGSKAPEPSRALLWSIGTSVALAMLLSSLWAEYRALPTSVSRRVRDSYYESFTPQRRSELERGVRSFVESELSRKYPPGGLLGYVRWAASNGELSCPRILRPATVEYRLLQRRTLWVLRVGLGLVMLEWTIMAQLLGLRSHGRTSTRNSKDVAT